MDHQAAQELFSDYLEGELPPEQSGALIAHLESCAACREEFEALQQTLRSLSGLRILPPPDNFTLKVQQRIHRRSRGRFFTAENLLTRLPFEWISFVIIILMLVVYILLIQGQVKQVQPGPGSGAGTSVQKKTIVPKRTPIDQTSIDQQR
jgi:predicted anti-sigma-YlaC factor YlaD